MEKAIRRHMHSAMQFAFFFMTGRIDKIFREDQTDHVQECINFLDSSQLDWNNDLTTLSFMVCEYGRMVMHDIKVCIYDDFPITPAGRYDITLRVSEAFRNKISFFVRCAFHRVFSRWCVISMDLDGQTLIRKACQSFDEMRHNIEILNALQISNESDNFKTIEQDPIRPRNLEITMSFPTQILPQCREVGLMI